MAKAIEFEIKIKGDSGVFKTLSIEATNADEAMRKEFRNMKELKLDFQLMQSGIPITAESFLGGSWRARPMPERAYAVWLNNLLFLIQPYAPYRI